MPTTMALGFQAEVNEVGAKIKRARSMGEAWPLLVFDEMLRLAARWDDHRNELPGRPRFNEFCREHCTGNSWNLGRWKWVAVVVERVGESARRNWTWPAAQWAARLPEFELQVVCDSYPLWLRQNHGHPLSIGMIKRHVRDLKRASECGR